MNQTNDLQNVELASAEETTETVEMPEVQETPEPVHVPAVSDRAKAVGILLPVALLCVGFIVGLLWFARPEVSETEKRDLTDFPTLTLDGFLSGEFTDGISRWYADTVPGREGLIRAYHAVSSLFGIQTEQYQGGVGEDVPDETMGVPDDAVPPLPDEGGEGGEQVGGYYVSGDTAYELYFFSQSGAYEYARLINRAAENLGDKATVYDMVIPLYYTFALGADVQKSLGVADGGEVMRYIYSGMSDGVKTVDVYTPLMGHRDEYIYFRTDHHWTATGAYYAYTAYCAKVGITPVPLESYEKLAFEGFLGTLYAKTNKQALADNPDTVHAYVPKGTNAMITHQADGTTVDWYSVVNRKTDTWYQNAASKYNCFIAGDHPLIEIHNENVSADRKGTSVVLVKESFGNAFAPFLVDSYEYVYIIDYRYYDGTLTDFVSDKPHCDVVFLNNVVATTAGARLAEMKRFIG